MNGQKLGVNFVARVELAEEYGPTTGTGETRYGDGITII